MTLATDLSIAFIVIGVLMLLAEAAMPGIFLLVPATVLLVLGALGFIFPDLLNKTIYQALNLKQD